MLVGDCMTKNVITLDANDYMTDAVSLLKQNNIHRLPVLEKGKLMGIVTQEDLIKTALYGEERTEVDDMLYRLSNIRVKEIMTKGPATIPVDYTVDEVLDLFLKIKISGAPVVDEKGNMVGIITRSDLLSAKSMLSGLPERGITFALQLRDHPGATKRVMDVMREYGGRLASVQSEYENAPEGFRMVYIRMYAIDRSKMGEILEGIKESAELFYMIDHSKNKRIICRVMGT
jgi:acetoin utilization protein AcuB